MNNITNDPKVTDETELYEQISEKVIEELTTNRGDESNE